MPGTLEEMVYTVRLRAALPTPQKCRDIRIKSGATLGDLAGAVGVSTRCIRLWERGNRRPRGTNRTAYVAALIELQALVDRP